MTNGTTNLNEEIDNPLLLSRALLSRLLSQSEVPLDVPIEELVAPDSTSVTEDGRSESSYEDQSERFKVRSHNFDNLVDKRWSPFDDPSMLKANRPREGSRKQRRWAHLYDIMKDADITEEDLRIFMQKDSTFSILMRNPELLKWWYQFTRASENAQLSYLRKIEQKRTHSSQKPDSCSQASAAQCFQRIERNNRKALKKSNIPTGLVAHIENNIIQYLMSENEYDFCDLEVQHESDEEFDFCQTKNNQNSQLTLEISDPFARLIGHSICQYYGLSSRSEGEGESRAIKAKRSKKGAYFPPPMRFSKYLLKEMKDS